MANLDGNAQDVEVVVAFHDGQNVMRKGRGAGWQAVGESRRRRERGVEPLEINFSSAPLLRD